MLSLSNFAAAGWISLPRQWGDFNKTAKKLFQRKKAEGREWYQAMPFVCAALARHIYHCLKFNDPYDVEKAFGGSSFPSALDEEALDLAADLDEKFEVMEASLDEKEG